VTETPVTYGDTQNQEENRIITLTQCSGLDLAWSSVLDISEQLYYIFVACDAMREYPCDKDEDVMFIGLAFIMEDILKKLNSLIDSNRKTIEKIYEQRQTAEGEVSKQLDVEGELSEARERIAELQSGKAKLLEDKVELWERSLAAEKKARKLAEELKKAKSNVKDATESPEADEDGVVDIDREKDHGK